jgi:hypothetical protein
MYLNRLPGDSRPWFKHLGCDSDDLYVLNDALQPRGDTVKGCPRNPLRSAPMSRPRDMEPQMTNQRTKG